MLTGLLLSIVDLVAFLGVLLSLLGRGNGRNPFVVGCFPAIVVAVGVLCWFVAAGMVFVALLFERLVSPTMVSAAQFSHATLARFVGYEDPLLYFWYDMLRKRNDQGVRTVWRFHAA